MIINPACEKCRFWEPTLGLVHQAECRRHGPQIAEYSRWPVTNPTEWCGEFEPKEKQK